MRRAIPHRTASVTAVTAFVAVLLLCLSSVALAELTPQRVRGTKAKESGPAASADYLAWNRITSTGRQVVWAMAYGQEPFRVNPKGTEAATGGIDGTTLVYQEFNRRRGKSDIFFFDLATRVRTEAPGRVNTTRQWEDRPSISGDWVLFSRLILNATGGEKILLYNMATAGPLQVLARTSGTVIQMDAGQVNGNYAVWHKWTVNAGNEVFLYDIAAGTTMRIPNPGDMDQYAPSVNPAGTVFYSRYDWSCGSNAKLMAYPIGGPAETLVSFGAGQDFWHTYALDNGDGTTDVFYDPSPCTDTADGDIYKVTYS